MGGSQPGIHRPWIAALALLVMAGPALAQEDAAPRVPVAPAALDKLFTEAEKAFGAKEYNTVVTKLSELLKLGGNSPDLPVEFLMFNLGLANLLQGNSAEAERAFDECAKKFPQGEYTSRCYLGIGKAIVAQDGAAPGKAAGAIAALTKAAEDRRYSVEASLPLASLYLQEGSTDKALALLRGLMGVEVRTPQQTSAAVEAVGLLAENAPVEDLAAYLDYLAGQPGLLDYLAWCSNQLVVKADSMVAAEKWEAALAIYRAVPPRAQILKIQAASLDEQRKKLDFLRKRRDSEAKDAGLSKHSNLGELIAAAEDTLKLGEQALAAIEGMKDFDASLLMRRGRCFYYLGRREEALTCFIRIRIYYPEAQVAQAAAYGEIVIYNELKDSDKLQALAETYAAKYPKAPNVQVVATLVGELLMAKGDWMRVLSFYKTLAENFPQSPDMARFRFYQAVARFQLGEFEKAVEMLQQFLKDYPRAPRAMRENALYRIAMGYFLDHRYDKARHWCREYVKFQGPPAMRLLQRIIPGCHGVYRPPPEATLRRVKKR